MATRRERRVALASNVPVPVSYKLIEELVEQGNENAELLQVMLNEEIYATRLKIKAHKLGFITDKQFVNIIDVYDLPLGMDGKEFMLANYVVEEMDRFSLSTTIAKKGDLLTAFFVDRYDNLYDTIVKASKNFQEDKEFQEEFVAMLLDNNAEFSFGMISEFIEDNPKIKKLLK